MVCSFNEDKSLEIFNVTVEHLLILSPETVLNNQVPNSAQV